MRVLVTGASGHIGGAAALALSNSGHDVVGLSRGTSDSLPPALQQVQLDIGEGDFVESATQTIARCDAVVHAAAALEPGLYSEALSRTNCRGTQQLLRLAHEWEVHDFVYISGVAVIGLPQAHPITEEHPTRPESAYAASKLFGEHLVSLYAKEHACGTSLRVTSPVGPGLRAKRIFSTFIDRALRGDALAVAGKGGRRQDYVDVRDVASALKRCLERHVPGVLNIGSGVPVSNLELAEAVVSTLQSDSTVCCEGEPGPDEQLCWDVSLQKAREALGYEPEHSLEDSVRALAAEMQAGT